MSSDSLFPMLEHGTVTGNVSRTHHPCGACGELVEACRHKFGPGDAPSTLRARRAAERREATAGDLWANIRRSYADAIVNGNG